MILDNLSKLFESNKPLDVMTRYHLSTGGKCLRAKLAISEATAIKLAEEPALKWAMVCELLHNATLIHDDIQDNDPIRRGQASVWKKFGVAEAINVGDYLIFKCFNLAAQLNSSALVKILADSSEKLVHGQMEELISLQQDSSGYWNAYVDMAIHKTGVLFLLPIRGIHILKNDFMPKDEQKAWLELGVCYQIYDDINDYLGLKQIGQKQKDFTEKRINALLAWLSRDANNKELINRYLLTPIEDDYFSEILTEIDHRIAKNNVLAELTAEAEARLQNFSALSSEPTGQLILSFFRKNSEKMEVAHA